MEATKAAHFPGDVGANNVGAKQGYNASRRPAPRARLSSRMPPGLRRSSKDLMASFAGGLNSALDASLTESVEMNNDGDYCGIGEESPASVAQLAQVQVAANDQYFEEERAEQSFDAHRSHIKKNVHPLRNSVAGCVSVTQAASLVANDYFGHRMRPGPEELLGPIKSLLDDDDDDDEEGEDGSDSMIDTSGQDKDGANTATTCSETNHSFSPEDALAMEVGHSAYDYLEECFYTEVSVLDREKFNAIPEIFKSDFTITGHLGKGSFSDVFEVVRKEGQPLDAEAASVASSGGSTPPPPLRRRASRGRRSTLSHSINTCTLAKPSCGERQRVFAMKCLRPQIRSDADQFTIGAEDLVHETAILATLDHPNIIKLHARASGNLSDAFVLNDGYFVLLDRLSETLQDRIDAWKLNPKCTLLLGPAPQQIEAARSVADAMAYLHSKNIVFRDLKPANVGFDSAGVLKLFDFGFAIGMPERNPDNPAGFLFDRCGTPRYMAPEVGLGLGYGPMADVYSFGILMWEMCALAKPFASITSSDAFERAVFMGGRRPAMENRWPRSLRALMSGCWSPVPSKRPKRWLDIKSCLSLVMNDVTSEKKPLARTIRPRMTRRQSELAGSAGWY